MECKKWQQPLWESFILQPHRPLRSLYSAGSVFVAPTYGTWRACMAGCGFCKRKSLHIDLAPSTRSFHNIQCIRHGGANQKRANQKRRVRESANGCVAFGKRFGYVRGCICSVSQARQEGSGIRIERWFSQAYVNTLIHFAPSHFPSLCASAHLRARRLAANKQYWVLVQRSPGSTYARSLPWEWKGQMVNPFRTGTGTAGGNRLWLWAERTGVTMNTRPFLTSYNMMGLQDSCTKTETDARQNNKK